MLMAGHTVTQMDLGKPKRAQEVPVESVPSWLGASNPPGPRAPAAKAASARGCREGEAPGAARRQRRGQRSHLITGASCPHFHSQNPQAGTGLAAGGRNPAGTLVALGEALSSPKPMGKGASASPEPGPRPAAPRTRPAEPGVLARGSPHLSPRHACQAPGRAEGAGNSFALGKTLLVFIIPGTAPPPLPKRGCLWGERGPMAWPGSRMGTPGWGPWDGQAQGRQQGKLLMGAWLYFDGGEHTLRCSNVLWGTCRLGGDAKGPQPQGLAASPPPPVPAWEVLGAIPAAVGKGDAPAWGHPKAVRARVVALGSPAAS